MAKQQFCVNGYKFPELNGKSELSEKSGITEEETNSYVKFSAAGTDLFIGKRTGWIDYLTVDGKEMLQFRESIVPEFWRAPTDNDYGAGLQNRFSIWKNPEMRVKDFTVGDNSVVVTIELREPQTRAAGPRNNERRQPFATLTMTYTLTAEGEVIVREQLNADKEAKVSDMFRYGMTLQMPKDYDQVQYYGRGPAENYIDRNSSEFIGIYNNKVQDEYFEYIRPQESGNHTDVRWFRVINGQGRGLEFYSNAPMEASAMPYTMDQLDDGMHKDKAWGHHSGDLIPAGKTQVFIQQRQFGLGCVNSWGAWPRDEYRLGYKDYDFTFAIRPLR
jgi:beta-galactosidase